MWDPIEGGYEVQLSMAAVTELQGTSIGSSPASNGQYGPIAMDSIGLYNLDLVLFDSEGNKA